MRVGIGMAVIGLGVAVAPLDTSVNVAFPAMTAYFHLQLRAIQWVIISYVLAYGGLMLVGGRLGDLYGYRRLFRIGLCISVLGLACCAMAQDYALLLAARIVQGIGAALLLSCAPALATMLVAEDKRVWAISTYGAMAAGATAIGPLLGGVLVEHGGWQAVYWFRVPICLAALALSFAIRPRAQAPAAHGFDFAGAGMLLGALSGLIVAAALARDIGAWSALVAVAGASALVLFVARQRRIAAPIIRPTIFAAPAFATINIASILIQAAGFTPLLLAPYFLAHIVGLPPLGIGALLAIWAGGTVIGTLLVPPLLRRVPPRAILVGAAMLLAAGLLATSQWPSQSNIVVLAGSLLAQGLGLGLFQVVYMDVVMAGLPAGERGVAASLAMLTRTLGTLICATGFSAWVEAMQVAGSSFAAAFATAFMAAGLAIAGLCALFAWRRLRLV